MEKSVYGKKYRVALVFSLALLAVGSWLDAISTGFSRIIGGGIVLNDLGFHLIAFHSWYPYVADGLLVLADIVFLAYVFYEKSYGDLPFYIACMALFQVFRSAILPLTPLATPIVSHGFGFLGSVLTIGGTFPSGHAGQVFTLFFVTPWKHRSLKYVMLALALLESFFMIAGRGHYTIDVVASFFITFFIYTIASRYWEKMKPTLL